MVTYQRLTAIAFEVAREKGAQFSGQRPQNATSVVEIVADEWNAETEMYRGFTEQQARQRLRDVIEVQ
jgi:hypothetical protein